MSPDSAYLRDAIAATAAPLAVSCAAGGVFTISHVHAGIVWIRHSADAAAAYADAAAAYAWREAREKAFERYSDKLIELLEAV